MNKAIFLGRLTKNLEIKVEKETTTVAELSLAVNRKFVKKGEEKKADFFSITVFNKQAELIGKYFHKGEQILVSCRIENSNYQKDGKTVYKNNYILEDFDFIDKKGASETSQKESDDQSETHDDLPFKEYV